MMFQRGPAPCRHIPTQRPFEWAWDGGYLARDQSGSASTAELNTCLDFYHKAPSGRTVNEPRDCCAAFTLGAWDLSVRVEGRNHGALEWEVKQTDVLAEDTAGCFYILLDPDVYSRLAATQHSIWATYSVFSPVFHGWKCTLNMKLKSGCFNWISLFVPICNSHGQRRPSPNYTCKWCMGVLVSGFTGMLGGKLETTQATKSKPMFQEIPHWEGELSQGS